MGFAYEQGLGVGQDKDVAIEWYKKAIAHGDPDAKSALDRLLKTSY
jgi:TPR repeat protein